MQRSWHACMLPARLHTLPGALLLLCWHCFVRLHRVFVPGAFLNEKECILRALFALCYVCAVKRSDSVGKIIKSALLAVWWIIKLWCNAVPPHNHLFAGARARSQFYDCMLSIKCNKHQMALYSPGVATHRERPLFALRRWFPSHGSRRTQKLVPNTF